MHSLRLKSVLGAGSVRSCLFLFLALPLLVLGQQSVVKTEQENKPAVVAVPVVVNFTDGTTMKLRVKEEKVTLVTPYGKLTIPFGEVAQIEFGVRIPEEVAKNISKHITDLGSDSSK